MYNIIILGLGNIGLRHFESLYKFNKKINFLLVDQNYKKLLSLKNKFLKKSIHNIKIYHKIEKFNVKILLAISATNSDVRYKTCCDLLRLNTVKNLIIEKIAFCNLNHYKKFMSFSKVMKTKTYINFPRRETKLYKNIKSKIKKIDKINLCVSYQKINIASNSIHYLDLFQFFKKTSKFYLIENELKKKIFNSKRYGFIEFKGKLVFKNSNNDKLVINENSSKIGYFLIKTSSYIFIIFEELNQIITINLNSNIKTVYKKFIQPYQSQLTLGYLKKIISRKKLYLTSLEDSFISHNILLKTLTNHLKKHSNKKQLLIT